MAFCGNCGFQNPDDARFCGNCGADLAEQVVGNVETIVNESSETTTDPHPMSYVPVQPEELPTPEPPVQQEEPPTPLTPEPPVQQEVPLTPPTPEPPVQPEEPPTPPIPEPPVQQEVPLTPPTPEPPVQQEVPLTPPTPEPPVQPEEPSTPEVATPPPAKKEGNRSKIILGCACAAGIALLLIIGGVVWWGYNSYMKFNEEVENALEWVDEGEQELEENEQRENELTEEQDMDDSQEQTLSEESEKDDNKNSSAVSGKFPTVTYNELPPNDMYFRDKEGEIGVKFIQSSKRGSAIIGTLNVTHWLSGESVTYNVKSCGKSIYQLINPKDPNAANYLFVYKGGKRLLLGDKEDVMELTMN